MNPASKSNDQSRPEPLFSADVQLELAVNGRRLPLAQIEPGQITLREAVELEPCRAEIVMTIDGHQHRWPVLLVDGAVPFEPVVRAERIS